MNNLWYYENIGTICITTVTGEKFIGYPIVVNDTDETESGEIEITLENSEWDSPFLGFRESEIDHIDILKE